MMDLIFVVILTALVFVMAQQLLMSVVNVMDLVQFMIVVVQLVHILQALILTTPYQAIGCRSPLLVKIQILDILFRVG